MIEISPNSWPAPRLPPSAFAQMCRSVADYSPQPMLAVDGLTHFVLYANPALCELLGRQYRDVIGRSLFDGVPRAMSEVCIPLVSRVFASGGFETASNPQDGSLASDENRNSRFPYRSYVAWAIAPRFAPSPSTEAEAPIGVMIQVVDATELASFRTEAAAINEALMLSNLGQHALRAEADRLNAELRRSEAHERESRQLAQTANRSKDMFLATLSHELRTPLNAVLGWAVLLRSRLAAGKVPVDPDLDHGLAVIERNARAQGKLIEEVLDVARVISGKFALELAPCELAAVMIAAVDAARPSADARRISMKIESVPLVGIVSAPLVLLADAARLTQAILNLLSNAVKFTPKGGGVTVRLERDATTARVIVSDSGIGIRPEFLRFVFDRFRQADEGNTRSYGGLGLGLTIARHIAELHGGTVIAHSDGEGKGATFTLELPTPGDASVAAVMPALAVGSDTRLDGLRVLVVDDEEDAREIARKVLESAGATIDTASSAEEGFQKATGTSPPPQILISDLGMPGEDGYSLIARLRDDNAEAKRLPAIALTAFAGVDERRRTLAAGFQMHLSKPIDPHELIAAVGKLSGRGIG